MTSPVFSFGIHILGTNSVRGYKNGSPYVECTNHPNRSANTLIGIFALATLGFNVGRFEARTAPGGTIIFADDFNGTAGTVPSGWTQWNGEGALDGAGRLRILGGPVLESGIYRTLPAGATYFELQGVTFDDETHGPHWGMVAPHWPGSGVFGEGAYRILAREYSPQDLELPDCTARYLGAGWGVGMVRMGAN